MTTFDVLLRGGSVVDGTGEPPRVADVAVDGTGIAAVARLPRDVTAATEIDVTGLYVMPGFIDAHVHGDALVLDPEVQLAALRQGITTFVIGQDGLSFAPASGSTLDYVSTYFGAVNGRHPDFVSGECSVSDLLGTYDRRVPLNTVYLAPHGTIRHAVMGMANRAPTADELAAMVRLVSGAMDDGAIGLSTGLTYLPGGFSDTHELATLCKAVAQAGGLHVTHMRGYEGEADVGIREVFEVAEASGCPSHVSHYHGPAALLTELLDAGLDRGLDVSFDSYPYLSGCSILAVAVLPEWLQEEGPTACARLLLDRSVRSRLRDEWFPSLAEVLPRATVSHAAADEFRWAEGLTLPAAAAQAGSDVGDLVCDLLAACRMVAGCVSEQPPMNTEEGMRTLLRHRVQMAGSDGIYVGGHPHPRGWGAFARLLGRHTRELGDYTWGQAAVHLAGNAAGRFTAGDRGVVAAGGAADLAVVDPVRVTDRATYTEPRRTAVGVPHVLVNGEVVLRDGALTGATPGLALRRSR